MKIGVDIRSLQEKQKSGVGEFTYNLLSAIFKIDAQNEYHLFSNASTIDHIDLPPRCGARVFHKHFKYPNKYLNLRFKFLDSPKIDKLLEQKLDVFVFPNINFYSLSPGIKKVLIIHDLSFKVYPEFYSPKGRLWHYLINAKKCCDRADKIVAVSRNTRNDLIKLFNISPEKITHIYPGISPDFVKVENWERLNQIKEKYSLPEHFIFYLGTLEPRKNIISLINSFENLKQRTDLPHELVLAGSLGYKSEKIFKKIKTSPLANQIKYIGYAADTEKPALYTLAGLFVYPSFYEGFGFPPVEAICCGTPTIASHTGSLSEVLGDYAPILVNPYNENELTTAMEKLIKSPELKNYFLESSVKIRAQYSWDKTAEDFLKFIQK